MCLANTPTAVKRPRERAHRGRTKICRLPTTLSTMGRAATRGQSSDKVTVAEIRCRSTNRLSEPKGGSAEPSMRRRAPAAAGSDGDAVFKVTLNDMLAG
jgi:hypothetical protein